MVRFTTALLAISALLTATSATPIPSDSTSVEKRVTHSGQATWFDVGLGACGHTDTNDDWIVAISHDIYGSGGNCNQYLTVTSGNIVRTARVRDECMGCAPGSVDMSPSFFQQFKSLDAGVFPITWHFESWAFHP